MIDMQMLEGKATICTDLIKHWKKYDLTDTKKEMEDFDTLFDEDSSENDLEIESLINEINEYAVNEFKNGAVKN